MDRVSRNLNQGADTKCGNESPLEEQMEPRVDYMKLGPGARDALLGLEKYVRVQRVSDHHRLVRVT